jgi:hypothetical protein
VIVDAHRAAIYDAHALVSKPQGLPAGPRPLSHA